MNWGYKILIVYLAFVAGIVFMVFKSSSQKIDLVTTDYYAKELKYQERIDAVKRTKALSAPLKFEVANREIIIHFPGELKTEEIKGTVLVYCPSDEGKDMQKEFTSNNGTVTFDLPMGSKGLYELQISWVAGDRAYYFEDKFFL